MIGTGFGAFLTLLILGLIASIVMHAIVRYWTLAGVDGFALTWIAGWIGAWLGSPVLGHWWFKGPRDLPHPCVGGSVCRRLLMRSPDEGKCALYLQGHGTEGNDEPCCSKDAKEG